MVSFDHFYIRLEAQCVKSCTHSRRPHPPAHRPALLTAPPTCLLHSQLHLPLCTPPTHPPPLCCNQSLWATWKGLIGAPRISWWLVIWLFQSWHPLAFYYYDYLLIFFTLILMCFSVYLRIQSFCFTYILQILLISKKVKSFDSIYLSIHPLIHLF